MEKHGCSQQTTRCLLIRILAFSLTAGLCSSENAHGSECNCSLPYANSNLSISCDGGIGVNFPYVSGTQDWWWLCSIQTNGDDCDECPVERSRKFVLFLQDCAKKTGCKYTTHLQNNINCRHNNGNTGNQKYDLNTYNCTKPDATASISSTPTSAPPGIRNYTSRILTTRRDVDILTIETSTSETYQGHMKQNGNNSTPVIAGVVCGVAGIAILAAFIVTFIVVRKRKQKNTAQQQQYVDRLPASDVGNIHASVENYTDVHTYCTIPSCPPDSVINGVNSISSTIYPPVTVYAVVNNQKRKALGGKHQAAVVPPYAVIVPQNGGRPPNGVAHNYVNVPELQPQHLPTHGNDVTRITPPSVSEYNADTTLVDNWLYEPSVGAENIHVTIVTELPGAPMDSDSVTDSAVELPVIDTDYGDVTLVDSSVYE